MRQKNEGSEVTMRNLMFRLAEFTKIKEAAFINCVCLWIMSCR